MTPRLTRADASSPQVPYASRPPFVSPKKIAAGEAGEPARLGYNLSHERTSQRFSNASSPSSIDGGCCRRPSV